MKLDIPGSPLPVRRPFRWLAVWILVLAQFLGNVASLPLLRATGQQSETPLVWLAWTALSVPLIALALFFADRTGLGAPLLEGYVARGEIGKWLQVTVAFAILFAIASSLLVLPINLHGALTHDPAWWQLVLAAVDAGVQEEIFSRFFLMTFLVWLGGLFWRDQSGRPRTGVIWGANSVTALLFGWAHIDQTFASVATNMGLLAGIMLVGTLLGFGLGWLYWRLGLECAILAHFLADVLSATIVIPIIQDPHPIAMIGVLLGFIVLGTIALRLVLRRRRPQP